MKVLEVLLGTTLRAVLPLLERRVLAAERQAASAERLEDLLRTYLGYSDPQFLSVLRGEVPQAPEVDPAELADASEWGDARDLKLKRMEQLRTMWQEAHGELLDDERLVVEYERLYTEAEQRVVQLDPDKVGPGVTY